MRPLLQIQFEVILNESVVSVYDHSVVLSAVVKNGSVFTEMDTTGRKEEEILSQLTSEEWGNDRA